MIVVSIEKQSECLNKNPVATISHNGYKHVLLNNRFKAFKSFKHSLNRTEGKNHGIGTYKIYKIFLSCFDNKIYILNNGQDGTALGY